MTNKHAVLAVLKANNVSCRNDNDRLIMVVHAYMLTEGFNLVATGEKADALSEIKDDAPEVGLDGWQDLNEAYSFAYVKPSGGSHERVQVTGIVMDSVLVVHMLAAGSNPQLATVELKTSDHTSSQDGQISNIDQLLPKLSSALEAALHGPTTSSKKENASSKASASQPEPGSTLRDLRDMPHVGGDDILPAGVPAHFPGRPGIMGDPDDPSFGGMHVGPDHPIFSTRVPSPGGLRDPGDLGPGRFPQGPMPGVRYDPIGPAGLPGYNARDFQRSQRQGHPDLELPGRGFGDPSLGSGFRDPFM